MIIQKKIGNIDSHAIAGRSIDWLILEWHETSKRVQRKRTKSGKEVSLKFLSENPFLTQGDILYEDEQTIIAVEILGCDCLVVRPRDMYEMASICYEIGNKHMPLFFEAGILLVPYEQPLFRLLVAQGYEVIREERKLLHPLRTTVSPHAHNSDSLFSRIMKLTASDE